jgi:uncharacterized damage-inducible protein DinB
MRRVVVGGFMALLLAIGSATVLAQAPQGARGGGQGAGRGPAAPACTTLACDVLADWERTRQLIVNIADAMPADKFSYKPTPAQRTYGEQVMHIVQVDLKLLSTLGAKAPAPSINMQATTKADVMAALRQSFDYGAAVLKEFDDQRLLERVASLPFMGPTASRARVIYFSMQHSQDIYGQMAVYLRLNDITPPASARQPA